MAKKSLKTARLALETSPTPKASGDVPTQTVTPLNDLPILISSTGQNVNLDTSFVVGYAHDSTGCSHDASPAYGLRRWVWWFGR